VNGVESVAPLARLHRSLRNTNDVKLSTLVKVAAALGARVRIMLEPHERQVKTVAPKAVANGRRRRRAAA